MLHIVSGIKRARQQVGPVNVVVFFVFHGEVLVVLADCLVRSAEALDCQQSYDC